MQTDDFQALVDLADKQLPDLIEKAQTSGKKIEHQVGILTDLPYVLTVFPDGTWDARLVFE